MSDTYVFQDRVFGDLNFRHKGGGCPDSVTLDVGVTTFHGHLNALSMARYHNRRAKEKVFKVVVRNGHFQVVEDA